MRLWEVMRELTNNPKLLFVNTVSGTKIRFGVLGIEGFDYFNSKWYRVSIYYYMSREKEDKWVSREKENIDDIKTK